MFGIDPSELEAGLYHDISRRDATIAELKLQLEEKDKRIAELEKQISDLQWARYPDRMGGQFTTEETNRDTWT